MNEDIVEDAAGGRAPDPGGQVPPGSHGAADPATTRAEQPAWAVRLHGGREKDVPEDAAPWRHRWEHSAPEPPDQPRIWN